MPTFYFLLAISFGGGGFLDDPIVTILGMYESAASCGQGGVAYRGLTGIRKQPGEILVCLPFQVIPE